ncbi:MAG: galactosyltransferase-related protein, partial [Candidatus Baltobacteraceae bacterium]
PPPIWTLTNYSGNYFWTTNVSVARAQLDAVGGAFTETFREYGWEDIELGLRLRFAGTRSTFNPRALVYHYKPPPRGAQIEGTLRQARSQARTAHELEHLQPHWRARLATGDYPAARALHRVGRSLGGVDRARSRLALTEPDAELDKRERAALRTLARAAYYDELERSK